MKDRILTPIKRTFVTINMFTKGLIYRKRETYSRFNASATLAPQNRDLLTEFKQIQMKTFTTRFISAKSTEPS